MKITASQHGGNSHVEVDHRDRDGNVLLSVVNNDNGEGASCTLTAGERRRLITALEAVTP